MILLIDNYDSFTYNLYQYVGSLNPDIKVVRNDALSVEAIKKLAPSQIILSPGPGKPSDAGICEQVLAKLKGTCPILGVCLGHQAIGEVFGGKVTLAPKLVHGKASAIKLTTPCKLFKGMAPTFYAARYHSLIVEKKSLPECLLVLATTEKDEVMALKHRDYEIYGVQFHPESIMTPEGKKIIENFLEIREGQ